MPQAPSNFAYTLFELSIGPLYTLTSLAIYFLQQVFNMCSTCVQVLYSLKPLIGNQSAKNSYSGIRYPDWYFGFMSAFAWRSLNFILAASQKTFPPVR